jgi:hypothetical protein
VYQLSDQRQNVVTMTSPNRSPDIDVAFGLTRGVTLIQGPIEGPAFYHDRVTMRPKRSESNL